MDTFEQRLRDDAALIRAEVSGELDERIRASLEAAAAEPAITPVRRRPSASWWWASSLSGLAAAFGLLAILNLWPDGTGQEHRRVAGSVMEEPPVMPLLRVEPAVLTAPLEQELDDLESDLRKARDAVSEDLGLQF